MTADWPLGATSADDAVACVRSGMRVFIHGAAATPTPLIEALARRTDLDNITLYHLHTSGPAPFATPEQQGRFFSVSLFTGPPLRAAIDDGRADFMPVFLSDIPSLFDSGLIPIDVALLQLSPPDRHGYCTLGTSVDAALAGARNARVIVAEINEQMPRTHGATAVPLSRVTAFVRTNRPLHEGSRPEIGPVETQIGARVAELIDDGACLQMGIGAIPDAVLLRLGGKNDLGVHTEMFSDGLLPLLESGVVNNRRKAVHRGRTVSSFVTGSRRLFDYVNDHPLVELHPCDRTNDHTLIRQNDDVVAINSALQVDLSGQVCADSLGHRIYSGIGGQMDFIRGAAESLRGKPVIALPSTAAHGDVSRITLTLTPGAGVVTTRGHVHWVVTEYGAVDLHGCTLRERADALISIAHPDHRAALRRELAGLRHY